MLHINGAQHFRGFCLGGNKKGGLALWSVGPSSPQVWEGPNPQETEKPALGPRFGTSFPLDAAH